LGGEGDGKRKIGQKRRRNRRGGEKIDQKKRREWEKREGE
jgi:hypothetical protein